MGKTNISYKGSKMKNSLGFPLLPRHNISTALQRLIKSFAQLFALEREDEVEMEIGFPMDVQHVSHIGMDVKGIGTLNNWIGDPELLSLSVPALTVDEIERVLAQTSDAIIANGSLNQGFQVPGLEASYLALVKLVVKAPKGIIEIGRRL